MKSQRKIKKCVKNNTGLKSTFMLRNILNGNNLNDDFPNLTPGGETKIK